MFSVASMLPISSLWYPALIVGTRPSRCLGETGLRVAGLEGDGGTGIFFRSLTLLLSGAILCHQESSSFIDVSFGRFPETLCILGVPAAHCPGFRIFQTDMGQRRKRVVGAGVLTSWQLTRKCPDPREWLCGGSTPMGL